MPSSIPYEEKYLKLCQELSYLALTKQRNVSPEASRELVQKLGEEHAIESIDMTIMKIVETHRLFCATSDERAEMEKCAKRHMGQLLRDLDYSTIANGEQLPLPTRKNAQNILLERFFQLVIIEYKLPRIYEI